MRLARHEGPVWQIVVVGVGVVEKSAFLDDQAARVGTEPAGVPAERSAPCHAREALDGASDVLALDLLAHELVVDPAPAVAHDLVPRFHNGGGGLGMALERHRHGEDADLDPVAGERPHEAPEPDAAAVLVHRLDLKISHALERRQTDDLLQIRLGLGVPVQGGALAALLVVHDDLQRQASAAGPLGIGRHLAVPDEVARVLSSEGASTAPSDASPRSTCAGGAGARTRSLSPVRAHTRPMPVAPRLSVVSGEPGAPAAV